MSTTQSGSEIAEIGADRDMGTATETSTGLDENVAGALTYLFGFITGIIFYLVEKENEFVRFHAAQSTVIFGGLVVVSIAVGILSTALTTLMFSSSGGFFAFGLISLVISLVWLAVGFGALVLWILLMVRAFQGKRTRIPIAAGLADRLV